MELETIDVAHVRKEENLVCIFSDFENLKRRKCSRGVCIWIQKGYKDLRNDELIDEFSVKTVAENVLWQMEWKSR